MAWLQLSVSANRNNADALEDALLAAGAVSVTFQDRADQPILEPKIGEAPLWDKTQVTGLFGADTDTDLATVIATASYGEHLPHYQWEILEDRHWEREWMQNYHPIQCGQRLWICPSWQEPPEPDAINLLLDPGLAFGTGTHPTTFLCLQWLDGIELQDAVVVDYGCGSGILGIAALLLGARQVIAIDIDPQALLATEENRQRNGLPEHCLHTYLPDQAPTNVQADIILANILAGPLIELAPALTAYSRTGSQLALSGLTSQQTTALQQAYEQDFELAPPQLKDDWVCLSGKRR